MTSGPAVSLARNLPFVVHTNQSPTCEGAEEGALDGITVGLADGCVVGTYQ